LTNKTLSKPWKDVIRKASMWIVRKRIKEDKDSSFAGLYEFFSLVEKKGVRVYKYFGTIVGIIIPLSIFYRFELTKGWELLFVVIGLISL